KNPTASIAPAPSQQLTKLSVNVLSWISDWLPCMKIAPPWSDSLRMKREPYTKICPRAYSAPPAWLLQQPVLLAIDCVLVILPPCVQIPAPSLACVLLRKRLPVMNTCFASTAPPLIKALFWINTLLLMLATVALMAPPLASVQQTLF